MDLIREAKKIKNGHACTEDIDLLVEVLGKLKDDLVIAMLGAGSNFTLTIFGAKPKATLYTIDKDQSAHWWEEAALENCGVKNAKYIQILGNSVDVASMYKGPKVDLLIIDSNHTEKGVLSDLNAWGKHLTKDHCVFIHDYDAKKAPYFYPGVKKACDKFFSDGPILQEGWSAVFSSEKPVKKTVKKASKK